MTRAKKALGRPKLPKDEAKGRIVPIRFTADGLKTIELAAKANKQTISERIRRVLSLEAKLLYKGYLIELTTSPAREGGYEVSGWITNLGSGKKPISVAAVGHHPTKETALEFGIALAKEKIYG